MNALLIAALVAPVATAILLLITYRMGYAHGYAEGQLEDFKGELARERQARASEDERRRAAKASEDALERSRRALGAMPDSAADGMLFGASLAIVDGAAPDGQEPPADTPASPAEGLPDLPQP